VYGPAIPASNAEFPNPDLVGSYPQVVVWCLDRPEYA
jgi:hypothetical protein